MQRDHAGHEIVDFDLGETRLFHHGFQRRLVGMHADRLREIAIAVGIAGHEPPQSRQHVEAVPVVSRSEWPPDARELEHRGDTARLQHAAHLRERAFLVRHVAQPEGDADAVECAIGKRQRLGIALHGGHGDAPVEQLVASGGEHGAVDVGEHHHSAGTDAIGEEARQIARAAGEIQHAHAVAHGGGAHREALPPAMQAGRHEIVHEVVLAGDRIEHAAHAPPLLLVGDLLVAEVGRFGHRVRGSALTSARGSRLLPRGDRDSAATSGPGSRPDRTGNPTRRCRTRAHR